MTQVKCAATDEQSASDDAPTSHPPVGIAFAPFQAYAIAVHITATYAISQSPAY